MAKFSDLLGKTLTAVHVDGDERIRFETSDGFSYLMYHSEDCCETVTIDDINGDLKSLIGSPILVAEEAESDSPPDGVPERRDDDSFTWTFYKIATIAGHVDIRWYGSSNGYYSESVEFAETSRP